MAALSLLSSLVVAVVSAGAPGPSNNAQPPAPSPVPIHIVSSSHEVRFPDEVVFRLEAEAAAPITEVTLFYRLARQKTRVYGYPDFASARKVSADFTLKTGGASYLPSGVDIRYHYMIRDADGNTVSTEEYSLEYKDPRFDWHELRQGDLVILYHDIPLSRVERVAADVSQRLEAVIEMLGLETAPPMKGVILNDRREALRGFPVISQTATLGHLYGGFAFGDYDLFVLAGLNADGMVHEMAHLLLGEAVASPLAKVPAWLNEGLATYFDSTSGGRDATLAAAARRGDLLRLSAMKVVPGKPRDVRLFYAQARSLVEHLVGTYGASRMTSLLAAIDAGADVEEAVAEVYGVGIEEIEGQWRDEVSGATTLAPRPDAGSIGTSALITGAVVVALVVTAYRRFARKAGRDGPDGARP